MAQPAPVPAPAPGTRPLRGPPFAPAPVARVHARDHARDHARVAEAFETVAAARALTSASVAAVSGTKRARTPPPPPLLAATSPRAVRPTPYVSVTVTGSASAADASAPASATSATSGSATSATSATSGSTEDTSAADDAAAAAAALRQAKDEGLDARRMLPLAESGARLALRCEPLPHDLVLVLASLVLRHPSWSRTVADPLLARAAASRDFVLLRLLANVCDDEALARALARHAATSAVASLLVARMRQPSLGVLQAGVALLRRGAALQLSVLLQASGEHADATLLLPTAVFHAATTLPPAALAAASALKVVLAAARDAPRATALAALQEGMRMALQLGAEGVFMDLLAASNAPPPPAVLAFIAAASDGPAPLSRHCLAYVAATSTHFATGT